MGVFEMVVAIVAISCAAGVINNRMRLAHKATSAELSVLRGKLERLESLEKRIVVLERFLTDQEYDLKREFADLERSA